MAPVDRAEALQLLPEPYARALRLRDAGKESLISERLGIEPQAVGPLIRMAEEKLARLLSHDRGDP
jgi:DNA-directed RNA polymerase specialized sigma24 family protein